MRESVLALRRYILTCLGVECLISAVFFPGGSDMNGGGKQHLNVADVNSEKLERSMWVFITFL